MSGKNAKFLPLDQAAGLLKALGKALPAPGHPACGTPACAPNPPASQTADIEHEMMLRSIEAKNQAHREREAVRNSKKGKAKKAVKPAKGQKPKQVLKANGMRAALEQILADERARETKPAAPVTKTTSPQQDRLVHAKALRQLLAQSAPAIEPRPTAISPRTKRAITTAIATGAEAFSAAAGRDEDGFIVGFDFGTSSVKLGVRQPYSPVEPAAMPVPAELQSGGHPYLWQTAVWFDPKSARFSLVPGPGREVLEGFKTGIIGGFSGERVRSDLPVTRAEAAIAFLALHLAQMLGWYHTARPLGSMGGGHFLSINIGIPVAAHDDEKTFATFMRIVAAAHALAPQAAELTLDLVRAAHQAAPAKLPEGYLLVPELTAAIVGYATALTSQPGSHILVDVGASTLDIVAFNLVGAERIAVFAADVELLGAAALDVARAHGVHDVAFKSACDWQFEHVYGQARSRHRAADGFSPQLRRRPVQLVTTGGGCATTVHSPFIAEMTQDKCLGNLPPIRPLPPTGFATNKCDTSRLLLAYGLTRDVQELLELKLPSQVPSIISPDAPPNTFVSKDMV